MRGGFTNAGLCGPLLEARSDLQTDLGRPLELSNLAYKNFKPALRRAELPESIRIYDLRHTCATLLLAAGANPKVVSERLGHSGITLTLDTYSHVIPSMQKEAADQLDALLA